MGDELAQGQAPSIEHRDEAFSIRVEQHSGRKLLVFGAALLPLPPRQAYELIIHPDNEQARLPAAIFKHLERCTHRRVLHEDAGGGRRTVESEHLAHWQLWRLHGTLHTRLRVEQDDGQLTARFMLQRGRLSPLRTFGGQWAVHPQPPERCAHLAGVGGRPTACCRVTLNQELQPAGFLPPPLGRLLKQVACNQLRSIFQDLSSEAARINSGQPTLWGRREQQQQPQPAPG